MQLPSVFPWNAPPVLDQFIYLPQPQSAVVLVNSFGSNFPIPSLKSSKLKHLDEPRKNCKRCPDFIPSSLCFENHCTCNISLHIATSILSARAPGSESHSAIPSLCPDSLPGFKSVLLSAYCVWITELFIYVSPSRKLTAKSKDPRKKELFGL